MKTTLLLLLITISFCTIAQRDFDYFIYTNNAYICPPICKDTLGTQRPLKLNLNKYIKKEGNTITIVNLTNSGNSDVYNVEFIGWSIADEHLVYKSKNDDIIYINPLIPEVIIYDKNKNELKYF
jgi:hypothetical protein